MREVDVYLAAVTRRFAGIRGVWRVSERLRRHFVARYAASVDPWCQINDFAGTLRLRLDRSSFIGSLIYWNGAFSPNELALLKRLLRPEMVFVDIGANQGEMTVLAAAELRKGTVLAFEPMDGLYRQLLENVNLNGFQNVKALRIALSDKPGRLTLYTDTRRGEGLNEGTASFFAGGYRTTETETVDVQRFDDVFEGTALARLDVIKIDVEGAELFVLRGASKALRRHRPYVILEISEGNFQAAGYSSSEVLQFLNTHGYSLSLIGRGGELSPVEGRSFPTFCNVLCTPSDVDREAPRPT